MLPDPLHPALVHLPLALAVLTPALALLAMLAMRVGFLPARAWVAVVLLQALMLGSAWAAQETGEAEEERALRVVAERHIEDHEEAAEWFLGLAAAALMLSAAGCLSGHWGRVARYATLGAGVGVLAAGLRVGHSGGELVYRHGAAAAYTESANPAVAPTTRPLAGGSAEGR